ncbi:AI-2E family transporter [Niveispirillum sp. SYP-B3756]|uniref:AI-2E family transporter n=1 Tax=Niveispirillum sp. SYP-B3756 TaxID=2662178 RepID=UPI001291C952|nr:AI-2E family transporter [Niveispirillum sp. SYP-B3756]MQP64129.1 AI-2E family transporter [Niveispirillum sp. SYP-B3756]
MGMVDRAGMTRALLARTAPTARGSEQVRRVQTWLLGGLLALALMYTLYFARDILLPVFLAVLLALLLRPVVRLLHRLRLPEPLGAALVLLLVLGALGAGAGSVADPAVGWVERAPQVMETLQARMSGLERALAPARQATERLQRMTRTEAGQREVVMRGPALADIILGKAQSFVTQGLGVVALTYFFLAFGKQSLLAVLTSLPRRDDRLHVSDIVQTVQVNITAYLATITLINAVLALVTAGIMWTLGVPSPLLWGAMAGLFNFIPYLGPAATTLVLFAVGVVSFDNWTQSLLPALCFIAVTSVEGNFLTPMIVGRRLTLNPIFVFATVLFWGWLWGIAGALLAVPILAVTKILCDATPPLRTVGALLGGMAREAEVKPL